MISFILVSLFFIPYYIILLTQKDNNHLDVIGNTISLLGEIGFVIHDWIFTEIHFKASLSLPIALDSLSAEEGS